MHQQLRRLATAAAAWPRARFGRRKVEVTFPALGGAGFGCTTAANFYGVVTHDEAVAMVTRAFDDGINFVDVSPLYGDAEYRLGLALQGRDRRKLVIQTKCGTHPTLGGYSRDAIMRSVENSLRVMGVDYLDALLLHDPSPRELQQSLAPGGALEAMIALRDQGITHNIGIGVREHEKLLKFMGTGECDVILTYLDYNLMNRSATAAVLPEAARRGITVVSGSTFYTGLLSGDDVHAVMARGSRSMPPQCVALAAEMHVWCRGRGLLLPALAIEFVRREPRIATTVIGARTQPELLGVLAAARAPVAPADLDAFEAAFGDRVRGFRHHFFYKKPTEDQ